MDIKHKLISVLGGVALVGGLSVAPAAAAPSHGYGSQPGYGVATANTDCAGHGSFGAFGDKGDVAHDLGVNNPGSNDRPGASNWQFPGDYGTTGGNNSALCGNQASPPPFTG